MLLILGDDRLDLGEFPNLMTDGFEISPVERFPAASTRCWYTGDDRVAVFDGNEGSFVFGVTGLTAVRPLGLGFGSNGLGVRVFGGRRFGGVCGVFADFGFEFSDTCVETFDLSGLPLNEGEDCRWEGSQDIRWKGWRSVHAELKSMGLTRRWQSRPVNDYGSPVFRCKRL
jgi:hypothetical protein